MPVVIFGISGAGPGLAIFMNNIADRVMYTVGEMVITRNPSLPPPERLLHRHHVGRDLVDPVDQSVVCWHPADQGYNRMQEGLHKLVNRGWYCGGRSMDRRGRRAGCGLIAVEVLT